MNLKKTTITEEAIFRTMREILLEAPPGELSEIAKEAGLEAQQLAHTSRQLVEHAIKQSKQASVNEMLLPLHKGLNLLLIMLRRRDGLDEDELARKANIDSQEIRRIEYDPEYLPSPRTIYKLEQAFSLPAGVLAKLSGAVKHRSPDLEERVLEFAANAKSIGRLTREEKQLLNQFVRFLTEQG